MDRGRELVWYYWNSEAVDALCLGWIDLTSTVISEMHMERCSG